jgi:AcrR family transcriptional regulator
MARQIDEAGTAEAVGNRSDRKRRAILDAATEVFLRHGYLGTNMDEVATLSGVSKQTIYKHFSSKEALFVEIVSSMTNAAGDTVHNDIETLDDPARLEAFLVDYAQRQLTVVLTPRIMQLRRLVIGEVGRFPELARVLYERGPKRALGMLATLFATAGRARTAAGRRRRPRRRALQLAGDVAGPQRRHAARRQRHPRPRRAEAAGRGRCAGLPRRLWAALAFARRGNRRSGSRVCRPCGVSHSSP